MDSTSLTDRLDESGIGEGLPQGDRALAWSRAGDDARPPVPGKEHPHLGVERRLPDLHPDHRATVAVGEVQLGIGHLVLAADHRDEHVSVLHRMADAVEMAALVGGAIRFRRWMADSSPTASRAGLDDLLKQGRFRRSQARPNAQVSPGALIELRSLKLIYDRHRDQSKQRVPGYFGRNVRIERKSDWESIGDVLDRPVGAGVGEFVDRIGAGGDAEDADAGAVAGANVARGVADGDRLDPVERVA